MTSIGQDGLFSKRAWSGVPEIDRVTAIADADLGIYERLLSS